jgi:hypothetical protein
MPIRGRRATEADSKHRFPVLESRPTEPGGPGVILESGLTATWENTEKPVPKPVGLYTEWKSPSVVLNTKGRPLFDDAVLTGKFAFFPIDVFAVETTLYRTTPTTFWSFVAVVDFAGCTQNQQTSSHYQQFHLGNPSNIIGSVLEHGQQLLPAFTRFLPLMLWWGGSIQPKWRLPTFCTSGVQSLSWRILIQLDAFEQVGEDTETLALL